MGLVLGFLVGLVRCRMEGFLGVGLSMLVMLLGLVGVILGDWMGEGLLFVLLLVVEEGGDCVF